MVQARAEIDAELADLPHMLLPPSFKRGVAPAMGLLPECTFWGVHLVTLREAPARTR